MNIGCLRYANSIHQMGGFKKWPLLEDYELVRRLGRKVGAPALVPIPVETSARRYLWRGVLFTTALNQ
eukprot:7416449-Ditylum_brightwellii.AAC.1